MRPSFLLFVLIGCTLIASASFAQGVGVAVSYFDEGNRLYREGDYRGALRSYERALEQGYASDALYFNMGNAYFRLDRIGQAIRHYEKARRMGSDRPELTHNLEIARELTIDTFSRLPAPFWTRIWRSIVRATGAGGLFGAGLILYIVGCAALAVRIRKGPSPWLRRITTVTFLVGIVLVASGLAASAEVGSSPSAVVLAREALILKDPSGASADVVVHEGLVVDVVSSSGQWAEIRLPNGTRGWMQAEDLGEI